MRLARVTDGRPPVSSTEPWIVTLTAALGSPQSAFRPMELKLDGVGCFNDLFWVGLENNPGLQAYVKRLRRELAAGGIGIDNKKFLPHITLIRRASVRGGGMIPVTEPPKGSMRALRVSLMRSDRGKNGMIYTEIGSVGE